MRTNLDWRMARSSPADRSRRGNPKRAGGCNLEGVRRLHVQGAVRQILLARAQANHAVDYRPGFRAILILRGDVQFEARVLSGTPQGKFVLHFDETDIGLAKTVLGSPLLHHGQRASLVAVGRLTGAG